MEQYVACIFSKPEIIKKTGRVQYMDSINIDVDNIPCRLFYKISKGYWDFPLQDREIYDNKIFNGLYKYYYNSRYKDSRF